MKRIFFGAIILAVLTAGLCAAASADGGAGWISFIPDEDLALPAGTTAQSGAANIGLLLDDNASTVWGVYTWDSSLNDSIPDMTFVFPGSSIGGLWIRAGHCGSQSQFSANAFPSLLQVRVVASGYSHDFSLTPADTFNPYGGGGNWNSGYQYLAFPENYYNVTRIELSVTHWRGGSTSQICISDLAFVQGQGGGYYPGPTTPSYPVPVTPSYPVPSTPEVPYYSGWSDTQKVYYDTSLIMRLATRSGPSTNYTELGSYFSAGDSIRVLTCAFDKRNDIYWVQVEFSYRNQLRRAYTGLKRVNASTSYLPVESAVGKGRVTQSVRAYYGPGTNYTMYSDPIPAWTEGTVYNVENGYVQLEFQPSGATQKRRVWIEAGYVQRLN